MFDFSVTILFDWFDSLHPSSQSFSYVVTALSELNQFWARIYVALSRAQSSDTGDARTRGPFVSSQALFRWATVLPFSETLFPKDW